MKFIKDLMNNLVKNFLNEDQFKLYDLIWRRTVASQMAESENKKTTKVTNLLEVCSLIL